MALASPHSAAMIAWADSAAALAAELTGLRQAMAAPQP
jgi:hypothetical protein